MPRCIGREWRKAAFAVTHHLGRDWKTTDKLGVPVTTEKVTDYAAIAGYGIASTPGIVIDGKVVHAGGLPKSEDLARWLAA